MLPQSIKPLTFRSQLRWNELAPHPGPALVPHPNAYPEEQPDGTLIITVQLSPPSVHERWIHATEEACHSSSVTSVLHFANLAVAVSSSGQHDEVIEYHLPQSTLDDYMDKLGMNRVAVRTESKTYLCQVLLRLSQLILSSVQVPQTTSSVFLQHFASLLCAQVVHLHSDGPPESVQNRGGLSAWQKRIAIEVLAKNGYENTKLSTLAIECNLSVSHFARSFKTTFGQPFHRWLVHQRVERAKGLLLHSDAPLVQIAFQSGFSDQATFNRTFANLVGTSPGRWRKMHKKKGLASPDSLVGALGPGGCHPKALPAPELIPIILHRA